MHHELAREARDMRIEEPTQIGYEFQDNESSRVESFTFGSLTFMKDKTDTLYTNPFFSTQVKSPTWCNKRLNKK